MLGMYYLRSRPAADAIKFTVDVEMLLKNAGQIEISKPTEGLKENGAIMNGATNKENHAEANGEESGDQIVKKVKQEPAACPFRRKKGNVADDEPCMSCGS